MTWARCIACGEMCGHPEQAEGEVERLRAESAELRGVESRFETYVKMTAAEIDRLRAEANRLADAFASKQNVLLVENAELRATLQQQREIWNMSTPNIRGELEWFRRRKTLSDELQSVYAALSESHDAIVEATGKLFDFDLTKPRAGS